MDCGIAELRVATDGRSAAAWPVSFAPCSAAGGMGSSKGKAAQRVRMVQVARNLTEIEVIFNFICVDHFSGFLRIWELGGFR